MKYVPKLIKGEFFCAHNKLIHLEDIPEMQCKILNNKNLIHYNDNPISHQIDKAGGLKKYWEFEQQEKTKRQILKQQKNKFQFINNA